MILGISQKENLIFTGTGKYVYIPYPNGYSTRSFLSIQPWSFLGDESDRELFVEYNAPSEYKIWELMRERFEDIR